MKISLASGGLDFHPSHVIALLGSPFPYSVLAGERVLQLQQQHKTGCIEYGVQLQRLLPTAWYRLAHSL